MEEEGFLLTAVEAETTVLETTIAAEVLTEAATEDVLVEEAIDFAGGAEEAGLDGGFAEEGALEETFEEAFASEEGALEAAFAASEAGLALLVTVLVEVPLIAVTVFVTTISLPFAAAPSPATSTSLRGGAALTGTATQGVTRTAMASKTVVGGGGGGVTGW
jgi:hypothetical protein